MCRCGNQSLVNPLPLSGEMAISCESSREPSFFRITTSLAMYAKSDTESHRFFSAGRTRSSPEVLVLYQKRPRTRLRSPVRSAAVAFDTTT
jgi:hypothetical protein